MSINSVAGHHFSHDTITQDCGSMISGGLARGVWTDGTTPARVWGVISLHYQCDGNEQTPLAECTGWDWRGSPAVLADEDLQEVIDAAHDAWQVAWTAEA